MIVPNDANINIPLDPHYSYAQFYSLLTSQTNWDSTFDTVRDMSGYASVQYFVSGVFFLLGKLFGANYWICIYFARIGNIIVYCLVGYSVLKLIPFGRTVTLVFLLNPMLIQQEASCSADAITNVCCFLYVVFLIRIYVSKSRNVFDIMLLVFFAFMMSVCKVGGYIPLCLCMIIFFFKINNKKKRIIFSIYTLLIIAILYIYVIYIYNGSFMVEARELMRNPLNLIIVLANSVLVNGTFVAKTYLGAFLGSLDIGVYKFAWIIYLFLQISVIFVVDEDNFGYLDRKAKIVLLLVCLVEIVALYMTQVWWTQEVEHRIDIISGIQGRYFIPVMIIVLLCLCRTKQSKPKSRLKFASYDNSSLKSYTGKFKDIETYIYHNRIQILITICMCLVYVGSFISILHKFGV